MTRRTIIRGVGNETVACTDKDARRIHISASNFLGGVSVKRSEN